MGFEKKEKRVVDLDFSGVYRRRERLSEITVPLSGIPGTNAYCSEEAREAIRRELAGFSPEGIHFLDSGNYHYATLFWLEKIREPYRLVVFDHHTDLQPPAWGGDLLSCGSWIRTALLEDPDLREVWLAGPSWEAFEESFHASSESRGERRKPSEKEIRLISSDTPAHFREAVCDLADDLPVYLSVDKDILSKEELDTNWDQGEWKTEDLLACLRTVRSGWRVIGLDICGEPAPDAPDRELERSERIDRRLLQMFDQSG